MNSNLKSKLLRSFAMAASVGVLMLPSSLAVTDENPGTKPDKPVSLQNVVRDDTLIFYGNLLGGSSDNEIVFSMDGSHVGLLDGISFYAGNYPYTAIIPKSRGAVEDMLCPYFSLASRPYKIEQTEADELKFKITTSATKEEIATVLEYGCFVTDKPDMSKIEYKMDDEFDPFNF